MEPMMKKKREVSCLVPYRRRGSEFEFFLQKRDANAATSPNKLGLFGGGLESGETIEQALVRELQEELEYVPKAPVYFCRYEHATHINSVFLEEVGPTFENDVHVHEGQYGKFLTLKEVEESDDSSIVTLLIVTQVAQMLAL